MTTAKPVATGPAAAPEVVFDVARVRADFPILGTSVHGKPLVYLDNAATAQKPQVVLDRLTQYYSSENANVHRGVHYLSEVGTRAYEETRVKAQRFLNAAHSREIVFVRGTTEAINLIAATHGRANIGEGDEIIVSAMEHHSNIVPWQILAQQTGATLRVIPINDDGELLLDEYEKLLGPRTKLVSVVHVSNSLGTINPVKEIIEMAHGHDVPVVLDGAQAAPHLRVDVQELDCDFYAFSGHKLFGPTGIGILYGKEELLERMPPYQGGGEMIKSVTFEKTTYADVPAKFEAGTPHIAGVVGLGTAIDYVNSLGLERIGVYEDELLAYGTQQLSSIEGLTLIGTAAMKASILSFVLEGVHPHDIGSFLDDDGIAIRTGHHCTQPVMQRFGVPATARASLAFYNTRQEIDALVEGIYKAIKVLG
jgi:cysteine desulfurase/selenocysteine lyase